MAKTLMPTLPPTVDREGAWEEILGRFRIPTLPLVAQRLLEICQDPQAGTKDFAEIIATDPATVVRLIQTANSAYYGLRNKATNVEAAIKALGLKYTMAIALGFHLAQTLGEQEAEGLDIRAWLQAGVVRGLVARHIAAHYARQYAEEAFLIGLLQDCGVVCLAQALGKPYTEACRHWTNAHAGFHSWEHLQFGVDHMGAARHLVKKWRMPTILAQPIGLHHQRPAQLYPSDEPVEQLRQVAYFVANMPLQASAALAEENLILVDFAREVFGLSLRQLQDLLNQARKELPGIVNLFGDILPQQVDCGRLIDQARKLLSQTAAEALRRISELEIESAHLQTSCDLLAGQLEQNTAIAELDALTGLAGRRFLERYLRTTLDMVAKGESTLTVFFIDIDDFKVWNDVIGHVGADELLASVSGLIREFFPPNCCMARFGGDEFVIAGLGMRLKQALAMATGLSRRAAALGGVHLEAAAGDHRLQGLSFSIGVVHVEAGIAELTPTELLQVADDQMYQAKHHGKNGLSYRVLLNCGAKNDLSAGSVTGMKSENSRPCERKE